MSEGKTEGRAKKRLSRNSSQQQKTVTIPVVGTLLSGRYLLSGEIGSGKQGPLFEALDQNLDDHIVAVKTILPGLCDEEAEQKLRQKALAAMKLTHPNILRIHGFSTDDTISYFAMEHLNGGTLNDLILREPLFVDEGMDIARDLCSALDFAHKYGVIYNEINPHKIMFHNVAGERWVKITDLGLSSVIESPAMGFNSLDRRDNLSYISPEQLNGNEPTALSNQYSLAAILYAIFSGKPPFTGADVNRQVLNEVPADIVSVPDMINNALLQALSKDPEERFDSCEDFFDALEGEELIVEAIGSMIEDSETEVGPSDFVEGETEIESSDFVEGDSEVDDSDLSTKKTAVLADTIVYGEDVAKIVDEPLSAVVVEQKKKSGVSPAIVFMLILLVALGAYFIGVSQQNTVVVVNKTSDTRSVNTVGNSLETVVVASDVDTVDDSSENSVAVSDSDTVNDSTEHTVDNNDENVSVVDYIDTVDDSEENTAVVSYGDIVNNSDENAAVVSNTHTVDDSMTFTNSVGLVFVKVNGGSFSMGSNDSVYKEEHPLRKVKVINSFWMSSTVVTNGHWKKIAGALPSDFCIGINQPVTSVPFSGALDFCRKMMKYDRAAKSLPSSFVGEYRLPSEAEWEYAACGNPNLKIGKSGLLSVENSNGKSGDVKAYAANSFGLYGMTGNVWEWTLDFWHDNFVGAPETAVVWKKNGNENYRVIRGGSWDFPAKICTKKSRLFEVPYRGRNDIGFRVVLPLVDHIQ